MQGKVGTKATEYEQAKEEIGTHFKKVDQRLDGMINAVNTAVAKAQAEGAQGTELEETKQKIQQIIASLRAEPNKTYISSLDRAAELMENLALLTTELSLDYVGLRKSLELEKERHQDAGRRSDQGRGKKRGGRSGRTEEARRRTRQPAHQGRASFRPPMTSKPPRSPT